MNLGGEITTRYSLFLLIFFLVLDLFCFSEIKDLESLLLFLGFLPRRLAFVLVFCRLADKLKELL